MQGPAGLRVGPERTGQTMPMEHRTLHAAAADAHSRSRVNFKLVNRETDVNQFRTFVASAAIAFFAGAAHAQNISMTGDLGTASMTGFASPISLTSTSNSTPFSWAGPGGTITGDVNVSNNATGTIFTLDITNLFLTVTGPNSAGVPVLDVILKVDHLYQSIGNGTYSANHSLSGTWTNSPASWVQLDSIQDFGYSNQPLSTLLATATPFSLTAGAPIVVTSGSGKYGIEATLHLHADGLGTINLPGSAHVTVNFAPAPSAMTLFGVAGLLSIRRRR